MSARSARLLRDRCNLECLAVKIIYSVYLNRRLSNICFVKLSLRQLWRLLLRRAQVVHGRSKADDKEHAHGEDTDRFLERSIIPLPLLDDVMGFNADEALRTRRQLQQQEAVR